MGLFETLAGFLKGAVGNNHDNDPEDVLNVKRSLSQAGYYDMDQTPEPHGYITKEMDEGIRKFQKDNDLRVDGYMLPGGETESTLRRTQTARTRAQTKSTGRTNIDSNITNALERIEPPQETSSYDTQEQFTTMQTETNQTANIAFRDSLPIGAFGQLAQNVDATGREIRDNATSIPVRKPIVPELPQESAFDLKDAPTVNLSKSRVNSILNNTPAKFDIKFKKTDKIYREAAIDTFIRDNDLARKTVQQHSETIEKLSKKHGVDPDLVKSIMWDENARGDKFGLNQLLDPISSSQRPMNINGSVWSGLVGKKADRLDKPEENIEASVILIKRISDRIEKPTAGKIGSIWNYIGRENTNDFGNDVDIIYNQKPWKQKK